MVTNTRFFFTVENHFCDSGVYKNTASACWDCTETKFYKSQMSVCQHHFSTIRCYKRARNDFLLLIEGSNRTSNVLLSRNSYAKHHIDFWPVGSHTPSTIRVLGIDGLVSRYHSMNWRAITYSHLPSHARGLVARLGLRFLERVWPNKLSRLSGKRFLAFAIILPYR